MSLDAGLRLKHPTQSEPVLILVWCVHVFSSIVNAEAARLFCEHHECPANWKDADGENCCIHHANIHSCPLGYMVHNIIPVPFLNCRDVTLKHKASIQIWLMC